ncbi:hypothetical protein ARHIZOSPH14_10510 [Agromyces rhizosphaerae]|uniref:Uncharacterized protein n=1 Tax=Agromyces rhizosphaerae TaxID=88374 RepID=A0A9W6CU10_9MICO|nr:hypothetical protein [Agromyces rhizosphaerae]GLI26809.1 hypothetical protein ARHIZOSPH14_10510 [Agromyces rhizosphaerae]
MDVAPAPAHAPTGTVAGDRIGRFLLLVLQAFVAVTAAAGGVALILGSVDASSSSAVVPPVEYLDGSPFGSYAIPGVVLALVLGGTHAVAFVALLRRVRWAALAATVAGYTALIWIFVQMMVIPFSVLQAVYFGIGLAEVGLVLLALGVFGAAGPGSGAWRTD